MKSNYPSADVKKFGLIGTSCAGKTTLAYEILAMLKRAGINADGVLQQDRRFSFQRELLEIDPIAQWSFIANQVKAEADMMLRPGTDVLICDRTPLDFYAYYEWQYGKNKSLRDFAVDWCKRTYTKIYLLDALPYQNDGARLNEEGRNAADIFVKSTARYAKEQGVNIIVVSDTDTKKMHREYVPQDVLIGCSRVLQEHELKMIPATLGLPCALVGGSYAFDRATKKSDLDVYIQTTRPKETGHPDISKYVIRLKDVFGIDCEVRGVTSEVYDFLHKVQGFKEYTIDQPSGTQ